MWWSRVSVVMSHGGIGALAAGCGQRESDNGASEDE